MIQAFRIEVIPEFSTVVTNDNRNQHFPSNWIDVSKL
jgi:hypothetical protein